MNTPIETLKDIVRYIKKYKLTGTHYNAIKGACIAAIKQGETK